MFLNFKSEIEKKKKEIEKCNAEFVDLTNNTKEKINLFFQISKQYIKKTQNIVFMLEKMEMSSYKDKKDPEKENLFTELTNNLGSFLDNLSKPEVITNLLNNTGKREFITIMRNNESNFDDNFMSEKELLYLETIKKLESQFKTILEKNKQISEEKYNIQIEGEKKAKEKYNKKVHDLKLLCKDKEEIISQLNNKIERAESKQENRENENNNKVRLQYQKVLISFIIISLCFYKIKLTF